MDNLPFEMIIGRDDIDKYDLWAKTKHYRNVKSVQTLVQPTKVAIPKSSHASKSQTTLFTHLPPPRQKPKSKKRTRSLSSGTDIVQNSSNKVVLKEVMNSRQLDTKTCMSKYYYNAGTYTSKYWYSWI